LEEGRDQIFDNVAVVDVDGNQCHHRASLQPVFGFALCQGLGFRVQGSEFRFGVYDLGLRVSGLGFRFGILV